jgi:pilus assembly protein CpaF
MNQMVAQDTGDRALTAVVSDARAKAGQSPVTIHLLNDAISAYLATSPQPMSLGDQRNLLARAAASLSAQRPTPAASPQQTSHAAIIEAVTAQIDIAAFTALSEADKTATIHDLVSDHVRQHRLQMNSAELDILARAVRDEMLGYGPLQALLDDPEITDIMVNGSNPIFIERAGRLLETNIRFRDDAHILNTASRIVTAVGRRIDESQPLVDCRLKDGSRVNIVIPPLAIDGPAITIRKFPARPLRLADLTDHGALTQQMADFLALAAELRVNILISGGTGSGKTTLLNALSGAIAGNERIVTLEDAAELQLQQKHVIRFETRPPNLEGKGEITMRNLLRNALRMRPDRIIIGEIRGEEALDLLQAMNTGHDGSMSTLHANAPREALTRVESMCALAGYNLSPDAIRQQLAQAVHLIVQVARMRDGKRRITSISEIVGMESGVVTLQDIFTYQISPASTQKAIVGEFRCSGYRPKLAQRAAEYGHAATLAANLGFA